MGALLAGPAGTPARRRVAQRLFAPTTILGHGQVSDDQALSVLVLLWAAWAVAMEGFCLRENIKFPPGSVRPSCRLLFDEAKGQRSDKVVGPMLMKKSDIEIANQWLMTDADKIKLDEVDDALVRQLFQIICPSGGKVYLDP